MRNYVLAGMAFSLFSAPAIAGTPFADDFNADTVNPNYRIEFENLDETVPTASVTDGVLMLNMVNSAAAESEEANYFVQPNGTITSMRTSIAVTGPRPETGRVEFNLAGRFYNRIQDGGPAQFDDSIDRRTDDINVWLAIRLFDDSSRDRFEYCIERRTIDGGFAPPNDGEEDCFNMQTVPTFDTEYDMSINVDMVTMEITLSVDDEVIVVPATTPMFAAASPYFQFNSRVRDGAETGVFTLSNTSTSNGPIDYNTLDKVGRYKTDDFDNFDDEPNKDKYVNDGVLTLSATNTDTETNNDSFLRLEEDSDYIEADIKYSSTSIVDNSAEGFSSVRIAGGLYRDLEDDDNGSIGFVWGTVQLIDQALADGLVGEYCLLRGDAENFSEFTDLADGMDDNRCPTFDLAVEPDTFYNAKMALDRETKTVSFTLSGETKVVNIDTDILDNDSPLRAQARIFGGATGTIVGEYDNLRNDPAALTDEEIAAMASDSSVGVGCTDTDGDGYGWDGTATCFPNGIDPSAGTTAGACIDYDGDGWGWNGVASCRLPGDNTVCTDSDGDGWGWTGSASCIVEADGSITVF